MSWANALLIAVLGLAVVVATIRSVPRRRFLIVLLLDLPLAVLLIRWAAYRLAWAELAVGLAGLVLAFGVWWAVHGRRLGPPREDNIRVYTQDDPP
ncbi:MAG TPA: hypothetical protein VFI11_11600 [Anaerolineales bacterium]|nr:hypothetical protein [Anaerolineales bacterium]